MNRGRGFTGVRKASVMVLLAWSLASASWAAEAPGQEQLSIQASCSIMGATPFRHGNPDNSVTKAIERHDWEEVRRLFSEGFPVPDNLTGRRRIHAIRAYRSVQLIYLSARGDLAHVNRLLAEGADPDVEVKLDADATPLAWAARCNHPALVRRLLRAGAQVNHRFAWGDTQSIHEGSTALIWASDAGLVDMVRLLLRSGARVDFRERFHIGYEPQSRPGVSALDVARNPSVARLLRARLRRY
jgi:hypothetical protein